MKKDNTNDKNIRKSEMHKSATSIVEMGLPRQAWGRRRREFRKICKFLRLFPTEKQANTMRLHGVCLIIRQTPCKRMVFACLRHRKIYTHPIVPGGPGRDRQAFTRQTHSGMLGASLVECCSIQPEVRQTPCKRHAYA